MFQYTQTQIDKFNANKTLPPSKVSSTGGLITYTKTGLVHISGKYKGTVDQLDKDSF